MLVRALVERIKKGDVATHRLGGYNFVSVEEVDRFAAVRAEEAAAVELADRERRSREQAEADGAHIVREMDHLLGVAEKYGFQRSQE